MPNKAQFIIGGYGRKCVTLITHWWGKDCLNAKYSIIAYSLIMNM